MAERPSSFKDIIGWWDTKEDLAGEIGASVSAVRKWWWRNSIPSEWWKSILSTKVARSKGLKAEMLADLASVTLEASR